MAMLEIKNIHKSFAKNEVLRGIDFEVNERDVVALIGPSGSGKTTLLRCINFLERADAGEISIDGLMVNFAHAHKREILAIRQKSAMVFQNYALFLNKNAGENIMEGLIISKKMQKDEARAVAEQMLDKVGLKERFTAKPYELSGGQQQRIGIARALALNPKVVLFDEPTSALDPEIVHDILDIIRQVAKSGVTMIIVTHEMQFAYDVATKVLFIDKGLLVEEGRARDLFNHPKEERTRQFLSRFNLARE